MAAVVAASDRNAETLLTSSLRAKRIAIAPCDTIYGILGSAPSTEEKIFAIKGRGHDKPLIELHSSVESVLSQAIDSIPEAFLSLWPGALTLIIPTEKGKTGFRVPADDFLLKVLRNTGPLYSTSVNVSGEPSLWRITDIKARFAGKVDLIVDGGDLEGKLPSTIIDVSEKQYKVVRAGAVKLSDEVLALCE